MYFGVLLQSNQFRNLRHSGSAGDARRFRTYILCVTVRAQYKYSTCNIHPIFNIITLCFQVVPQARPPMRPHALSPSNSSPFQKPVLPHPIATCPP